MTVITPAFQGANPDEIDPRRDGALRRRVLEEQQIEALRRRVAERSEPRLQHEEILATASSLAEANPPELVARRLDRVTRYYAGTTRLGYDHAFLDIPLPLPVLTADADLATEPLSYHHFSVVMQRKRKLALFTAVNIDGGKADQPRRDSDKWILDPRIPVSEQTGEDVYRDNDLDRGHLVRRLDPAWGPKSAAAVDDTFHFTNCAPQHHEFNAGRTLWLGLEDYVLQNAVTADLKISVLSGPVLDDDDPQYRGVALPLQYWKVVAMMRKDGKPSVTAYLLSQEALLDEFRTERTPGMLPESFSYGAYRTFQVPVRRIAGLTGLDLTPYIAADPLERFETTGLPRELVQLDNILL
jgi:endonuclease G, mitochondrial